LAAFFLAAGFLAAFFFAAMLVYLLQSISDPMNDFGGGSQMHSSKGLSAHRLVASVMATMSSIPSQMVVIPEQAHLCQWDSHHGVSEAVPARLPKPLQQSAVRVTH
jgi:hypothetical protein